MPINEKKRAANDRWDKKGLKRTSLALPVVEYEQLVEHIQHTGERANTFIRRAIRQTIDEEKRQE